MASKKRSKVVATQHVPKDDTNLRKLSVGYAIRTMYGRCHRATSISKNIMLLIALLFYHRNGSELSSCPVHS